MGQSKPVPVGHASLAHPHHHEGPTDLDLYRTFSPSDVGMWSWQATTGACAAEMSSGALLQQPNELPAAAKLQPTLFAPGKCNSQQCADRGWQLSRLAMLCFAVAYSGCFSFCFPAVAVAGAAAAAAAACMHLFAADDGPGNGRTGFWGKLFSSNSTKTSS
jgi:hypothetical protein